MSASKKWTNTPSKSGSACKRSQFEYENHPFQPGVVDPQKTADAEKSTMPNVSFARLTSIRLDQDLRKFGCDRDMPRQRVN